MSTIYIEEKFDAPRAGHVWRTPEGEARGNVDLGQSWITFTSSAGARELAAEILSTANAMDALPPAEEGGQQQ